MYTQKTSGAKTLRTPQRHPLINHNFALLWSGQTVSMLGNYVFDTTLIVWVSVILAQGQSWAPLAVSGLVLASSLPALLLTPVAGVFVDRWNKRRALLWSTFLPILGLAPLLVVIEAGKQIGLSWQLGVLYLTVFLINSCATVARPAWLAVTGQIVTREQQPQALGLDQASNSLAMLIGPILAPPLLLLTGLSWSLLINIGSFACATLTIFWMRLPADEPQAQQTIQTSFWQELTEGLRFLFSHQVLRTLLIASSLALLGVGVLSALDIFFVTQNLHTTPMLYGTLDAALGVGTILGAIVAATLGERLGLTRVFWASLIFLGIGLLVYARLESLTPALIVVFCVGIPLAMLSVAMGPLMLRSTPETFVGRVSSLSSPFATLATLLGASVAGGLASMLSGRFLVHWAGMTFGPIDTILMGTGLLLLISGLYAMLNLRRTISDRSSVSTHEA